MAFAAENLSILAKASDVTFLHYNTADDDHELSDPAYFNAVSGILRQGDLIFLTRANLDASSTNIFVVTEISDGYVYLNPINTIGRSRLEELANVFANTPTEGQVLVFKNGAWVNQDVAAATDVTASDIGAIDAAEKGQALGVATLNAEGYISAAQLPASTLASLRDVLIASPHSNHVLKFDGSVWIAAPESGAIGDAFAGVHAEGRGTEHATSTKLVAGFMSATDKKKLDDIESGATTDMDGTEIKVAYEAEQDTNAFTDSEKAKLSGIAAGAERNINADWNAVGTGAEILNKPVIPTSSHDLSNASSVPGATISEALEAAAADGGDASMNNEPFGTSWGNDTTGGASRASIYDKLSALDTEVSGLKSTVGTTAPSLIPVAYKVADVDNGFQDYAAGSKLDGSGSPIVIDLTIAYRDMVLAGRTDTDGGTGGAFALYIVDTGEKITGDVPFDEQPFRVACTAWADLSQAARALKSAVIEPRISVTAGSGTSTPDLRTTYLHVYYGRTESPVFGTTPGTACEGDDDRIPNADEEAFLATVSKSADDFSITPPNNGQIALNVTPVNGQSGFSVYSGGEQPEIPEAGIATFFGDVVIMGNVTLTDGNGNTFTITPSTRI